MFLVMKSGMLTLNGQQRTFLRSPDRAAWDRPVRARGGSFESRPGRGEACQDQGGEMKTIRRVLRTLGRKTRLASQSKLYRRLLELVPLDIALW